MGLDSIKARKCCISAPAGSCSASFYGMLGALASVAVARREAKAAARITQAEPAPLVLTDEDLVTQPI
mgnify:CR=1 FL=1